MYSTTKYILLRYEDKIFIIFKIKLLLSKKKKIIKFQKKKNKRERSIGKRNGIYKEKKKKIYPFSSYVDNPFKPYPTKFAMSFASEGSTKRKQRGRKKRAHGQPSSQGRNS